MKLKISVFSFLWKQVFSYSYLLYVQNKQSQTNGHNHFNHCYNNGVPRSTESRLEYRLHRKCLKHHYAPWSQLGWISQSACCWTEAQENTDLEHLLSLSSWHWVSNLCKSTSRNSKIKHHGHTNVCCFTDLSRRQHIIPKGNSTVQEGTQQFLHSKGLHVQQECLNTAGWQDILLF